MPFHHPHGADCWKVARRGVHIRFSEEYQPHRKQLLGYKWSPVSLGGFLKLIEPLVHCIQLPKVLSYPQLFGGFGMMRKTAACSSYVVYVSP